MRMLPDERDGKYLFGKILHDVRERLNAFLVVVEFMVLSEQDTFDEWSCLIGEVGLGLDGMPSLVEEHDKFTLLSEKLRSDLV